MLPQKLLLQPQRNWTKLAKHTINPLNYTRQVWKKREQLRSIHCVCSQFLCFINQFLALGRRRSGETASVACPSTLHAMPSFALRRLHHTLRTGGTVFFMCVCVLVCVLYGCSYIWHSAICHGRGRLKRDRNRHRGCVELISWSSI